MSYRDELIDLADETEDTAVGLYQRFRSSAVTADECIGFLASLIAQANSKACALADLAITSAVMLALQRPVPVIGIVPPAGDLVRLQKAATTVLEVADASPNPDAIVGRLARSEPLETAGRAVSEAMDRQPEVEGWVRNTGGEACQLCEWWARDGRVWPANHEMPTHKGCACTPDPVVRERELENREENDE